MVSRRPRAGPCYADRRGRALADMEPDTDRRRADRSLARGCGGSRRRYAGPSVIRNCRVKPTEVSGSVGEVIQPAHEGLRDSRPDTSGGGWDRFLAPYGSGSFDAIHAIGVWMLTVTEVTSALCRRLRGGSLTREQFRKIRGELDELSADWSDVTAAEAVRRRANRLLDAHPLRAADALQLASAPIAAADEPRGFSFVTYDGTLGALPPRGGFHRPPRVAAILGPADSEDSPGFPSATGLLTREPCEPRPLQYMNEP